MDKIDHSSESWKTTKNRMVLHTPNKPYAKAVDKDGMDAKRRKRIDDIKEGQTYRNSEDKDPLA